MMKRLIAAAFVLALSCGAALAQTTNAATTNGSVVIVTGNTFQTILALLAAPPAIRRSLTIQNNNATDSCWIQFGVGVTFGTATKGKSILLLAGGSYTRYFPYVPSDEIEATCATTADTMYVDVQ